MTMSEDAKVNFTKEGFGQPPDQLTVKRVV